jgi:hypothetical protein
MDILGNSGANTFYFCSVFAIGFPEAVMPQKDQDKFSDCLRRLVSASDLSARDGRVLAYRGCDG